MKHPQQTPPAYYAELATLLADDAEPLPTDILDFIDELELHDCAGSAERRAGAPSSTAFPANAQPALAVKAPREPEGTSPECPDDTGNASRIKRLRQRNREAQARFRLKQKGHRQQVEAKAQQTRAAIAETHKKIEALHESRKQLAKRQERADTMLEATLFLRAAVYQHADTVQSTAAPSTAAEQHQTQNDTASPLRISPASKKDPSVELSFSQPETAVAGIAPKPLPAFHAHLPISYKRVLGTDCMPAITDHPASTRVYNCCVADGLSAKCDHYRQTQAAQQGLHRSQVAWFAHMQTEVDAGVPLSFSTTVASPSCAASFVLAFLTSSMEAALAACLQDLQAEEGAGSPEPAEPSERGVAAEPRSPAGNNELPSPGQKRTRDAAALDCTTQPASAEAAGSLAAKRVSLDCYSPAHCTSAGVGTGSSAHSDQHFLSELRPDRESAPGRACRQTPSTVPSCGNYSCCNTAAAVTRADEDANSTGSAHSAIHLPWGCSDKSVQHARATLAKADEMHVSCGTKEHHPLVSAVKHVYKSLLARYCGHVGHDEAQKVCTKALHAIEEMLKGIYTAVEARERSPCSHKRSHVPNDCRFFRAMSEHVIGVLLTAQMEIRSLVHDLPTMVSAAEVPTAESLASLHSNAVSVMLSMRMGHMLLAWDCTTVLQLLTIDVLVPLVDCSEVDAILFKALQLEDGQRAAMSTFWQQWEERRRSLDETATAAIDKLAGLPTTLPVPEHIMERINMLCRDENRALLESGAAPAPVQYTDGVCCELPHDTQNSESQCGLLSSKRYCASADRILLQSKELPLAQGAENLRREHENCQIASEDVIGSTEHASTVLMHEKVHEGTGTSGLVGQTGQHASAAQTAIQMLTKMHRADKDLYIDCLDAQMPAAILSSAQVVRLWAASQMHEGLPFDFLNLCRMSSAQERRIQLLQKQQLPFMAQMLVP